MAIGDDIYDREKPWLLGAAVGYDTPFYDDSFFGIGKLSGIGCLNGKCYERSELNYIAQGELWAALRVKKSVGHSIVQAWKKKACFVNYCLSAGNINQPTEGTIEMFDIGFDHYDQHYPPKP